MDNAATSAFYDFDVPALISSFLISEVAMERWNLCYPSIYDTEMAEVLCGCQHILLLLGVIIYDAALALLLPPCVDAPLCSLYDFLAVGSILRQKHLLGASFSERLCAVVYG